MKKLIALLFLLPAFAFAQPPEPGPGRVSNVPAAIEAEYATMAVVAYGTVTNSYATALTNTARLRQLDITNSCDCVIYVSFNASTNHFVVPSSGTLTLNYSHYGLAESSNVSIKYVGAACTVGNVYVSGVY